MARRWFRRLGLWGSVALLTAASILVSVGLTLLIMTLLPGGPSLEGLAVAVLVPALISPAFSYSILRLFFQLETAEDRLRSLSETDDLTRVCNRRHFIELAERELERARRYGDEFAIVLFDIDNFKEINDRYGHLGGDQVLQHVCEVCSSEARAVDTFARYGGDEFVYLVPQSREIDLQAFMERIRKSLSLAKTYLHGQEVGVRVSMGASRYGSRMPDFEEMLQQADEALYRAKRNGGDQEAFWVIGEGIVIPRQIP